MVTTAVRMVLYRSGEPANAIRLAARWSAAFVRFDGRAMLKAPRWKDRSSVSSNFGGGGAHHQTCRWVLAVVSTSATRLSSRP